MKAPATDVLIIGRGVAGLTLALGAADTHSVILIGPADRDRGASRWAQGGIAAVLSNEDSLESHIVDTLMAGDGLCDEQAVRFCLSKGPEAIAWLIDQGVPFTRNEPQADDSAYHLTREGGHSARRIIHADDATGRAVVEVLAARVRAHPNITELDDVQALTLLKAPSGRCAGLEGVNGALDPITLTAHHVVLATGGASGLYRHTTSPAPHGGEGMMMAAALGAPLQHLEFQQFHPTCLFDPKGPPFLISEAVRGEGGQLLNEAGERFMTRVDARGELAPRDIVARAIDAEIQRGRSGHVGLDVRHLDPVRLRHHFPTIVAHCQGRGIDITRAPIPVVPAAHYSCGGVVTDHTGATCVDGLYAIGEVACTGLHGANRLASNSLLECLVYARSCAERLTASPPPRFEAPLATAPPDRSVVVDSTELAVLRRRLQTVMSRYVGIVRSDAGLETARRELVALEEALDRVTAGGDDPESHWLRQTLGLAGLKVRAAASRRESRGLHYSKDCPKAPSSPPPL